MVQSLVQGVDASNSLECSCGQLHLPPALVHQCPPPVLAAGQCSHLAAAHHLHYLTPHLHQCPKTNKQKTYQIIYQYVLDF